MESNWTRIYGKIALLSIAFCLAQGCGKEKAEKQSPPADTAASTKTENEDNNDAAPGGMELPDGGVPSDSTGQETPKPEGTGLEMPDQSSSTPSANIKYASLQDVQKFASETGKITVVDVWSTVCAPCVKEFPGLVKLHREQGDSIQCVSLDIDYDGRKSKPPETYEAAIVKFLTEVGADFPNFVCNTPSEDVYAALEIDSIPAVLIYNAQGELVKKFIDAGDSVGFTYEKDIVPFVAAMGN